ncbi:MAG: hypothetical protein IKI26_11405 [Prevotella sp.]|nr:hypothetical protein [Prevotella sp.]
MKKLRPIALWVGVLAVVAFVLLYVEADLLWKVQQHNVFLNTSLFFHQQMVAPGGMLSYLGAFFTQHFYYPWVGVVLICCWWLLLMWLTKRAFCIPEKWWVLTLIPVAILLLANMQLGYWVYVIKLRGFFFVATLGVTAGTALLWAFRKLPDKLWLRATFIMLATLVGYPLMGVYALFAVLLMGCLVWRQKASRTTQVILSVTALLSVVFIPLLFYRFVYYETNLNDIYAAALPDFTIVEHYSDYDIPYYVLAAYFLLLTFLCGRAWKAPKHPVMQWVKQGCVLVAVAGCLYYLWYKDDNFHHELRMQRCVEEADWEGVLEEGRKQDCEPTRAIVVMHNLALSRLGRQCDEMYNFRKGSKKVNTPLPIYMYHIAGRLMLYQYGMLNECHRICMEDGVEYGWNVEQLKYLARCAILGGEKQAARKFLDILRQTCYYGSWADHMEKLMNDKQLLANDEETGPITHMMHYEDHLDAVEGWVEKCVMTNLAQHDANDLYFQEQAVLGAMWTREPDYFWPRFEHYMDLIGNRPVPRIFQEAAWLFANMQQMEGLEEWTLENGIKESFSAFMQQMEQAKQSPNGPQKQLLLERFGNTYYFDFFFLRNLTYY